MNTTPDLGSYSELRRRMVRDQITSRGITNERLLALIEKTPTTASGLIQAIVADLHTFSAGEAQFDDITILAVQRAPA